MERTRLPGPVQAIAWNADFSNIAVSHGGSDVVVYEASSSSGSEGTLTWSKVATLQGHHQLVSDLDWAPKADQILSCSHDRNAFVWTRASGSSSSSSAAAAAAAGPPASSSSAATAAAAARSAAGAGASTSGSGTASGSGGWEKQMVITRLTKGALCVRWSPSEAKFAIGSAARVVSVGYYDPESKWWACKMIRKSHESSVVAVAWHPNSLLLATGSTDRRVRLFNAYVPGYEPEAPPGSLPPNSAFGDCIVEVSHEGCGWVHSVAWSPGDEALMYTSHDAVVGYVRGPQATIAVRLSGASQLPLKCLAVVSERLAVGAGWEGCLVVMTRSGMKDSWQQVAVLGGPSSSAGGGGSGGGGSGGGGGGGTPGGMVRQLAQMHISGGTGSAGAAKTAGAVAQPPCHSACVTGLHVRSKTKAAPKTGPRWHVASAGLDGQIILWDLSAFL